MNKTAIWPNILAHRYLSSNMTLSGFQKSRSYHVMPYIHSSSHRKTLLQHQIPRTTPHKNLKSPLGYNPILTLHIPKTQILPQQIKVHSRTLPHVKRNFFKPPELPRRFACRGGVRDVYLNDFFAREGARVGYGEGACDEDVPDGGVSAWGAAGGGVREGC
jgi:hypothetical protein